jgi:hypothetical protein
MDVLTTALIIIENAIAELPLWNPMICDTAGAMAARGWVSCPFDDEGADAVTAEALLYRASARISGVPQTVIDAALDLLLSELCDELGFYSIHELRILEREFEDEEMRLAMQAVRCRLREAIYTN